LNLNPFLLRINKMMLNNFTINLFTIKTAGFTRF
jgi:hypothetical protein